MDEPKVTFEGKPVKEFTDKVEREEILEEFSSTVGELSKIVKGHSGTGAFWSPGEGETKGKVRLFSKEEVSLLNDRIKAMQNRDMIRDFDITITCRSKEQKARLERLLAFIKQLQLEGDAFRTVEMRNEKRQQLYQAMGDSLPADDMESRNPYYKTRLYHDLKLLVGYGKIYSVGKGPYRCFYLKLDKETKEAKLATTGKQNVQTQDQAVVPVRFKVQFDLEINVRVKTTVVE